MQPPGLTQVLTQIISEMMARNRSYFGAGGPGYYGVAVANLSPDGSEFDLKLTFKSGVRYCCIEHGCHIPLYGRGQRSAGWFKHIRDGLHAGGFCKVPPLTVRKLHVVVEKGAITDVPHSEPRPLQSTVEYDCGPFHEVVQDPG
jgi:hypothetical protein